MVRNLGKFLHYYSDNICTKNYPHVMEFRFADHKGLKWLKYLSLVGNTQYESFEKCRVTLVQ